MSTNTDAYSFTIFLPDGDPDGLRIIGRSHRTSVGVVFPRSGYKEALKREEFQRTGVYILVGASNDSSLPTLYIGEGDPVRPRLDSHYAKKDFWDWAIFFVVSDGSLNKAHVKYLESRLIKRAKDVKQCNLDNTNSSSLPNLSEVDEADMESYFQEMLKILSLVGLSVFEKPKRVAIEKELLFIRSKGIVAKGYESNRGFVVVEGSEAVLKEVPSMHEYLSALRIDLVKKEVLRFVDDHYIFTEDYRFSSPSTAAGVVQGRSANGRNDWKNASGKNLKDIQTSKMKEA